MTDVLARFRIDGQVALITGAAGGLGFAAARALAAAGAHVALTSRELVTAQAAAAELASTVTTRVIGLAADVRDEASVAALVASVVDELGTIDILVNNAGTTRRAALETLTVADWDAVADTNLKGTWLCVRAVAPVMRRAGKGRIVNIASMFSQVGLANRSPYVASKGGVVALTRALAVELAPDGIRVNAISPGPFLTQMHDPAVRGDMVANIPLGRYGDPDELGPAIVYLASEASSFVTGANLAVDGGYTAR